MKTKSMQKKVQQQRDRRQRRTRIPILAKKSEPRLTVYRSGKHIFAQIIDDAKARTLVSFSDLKIEEKTPKTERAKMVGAELAKLAKKKKISKVVFDRGWYKFHGRVKALADSAREQGLKF